MFQAPIINKQISIPYLVKIGPGKLKKVGKYLVDKGMLNIAVFWGEGLEEIYGKTLNKSFKEHEISVSYKQEAGSIDNSEDYPKIARYFHLFGHRRYGFEDYGFG